MKNSYELSGSFNYSVPTATMNTIILQESKKAVRELIKERISEIIDKTLSESNLDILIQQEIDKHLKTGTRSAIRSAIDETGRDLILRIVKYKTLTSSYRYGLEQKLDDVLGMVDAKMR